MLRISAARAEPPMRIRPDIDQITSFLAVAEALSFRRAADQLGLDPSALSRRIAGLEARLGFPLLHRTTHAVRLTPAGETFYAANHALIGGLDAAIDRAGDVARGSAGRLRIGYMTFAALSLMPEAVRRFRARHPEIEIALHYLPTLAQKLSLARREIDVGLLLGPLEHADFATLTLTSDPLAAFLEAGHPLAARDSLAVAEVAREPAVVGQPGAWDVYRGRVEEAFALRGARLAVAYEAPDLAGMLGLVRAGLGVAVLPGTMRSFCPSGVVAREITDAQTRIVTLAAWQRPSGPATTAFLKLLREAAAAG